MRFNRSSTPVKPQPLQRRLVGLTFLIGMAVIFGNLASRPRTWAWLTGQALPERAASKQGGSNSLKPLPVPDEEDTLPPDAFRIPAAQPAPRSLKHPAAERPDPDPLSPNTVGNAPTEPHAEQAGPVAEAGASEPAAKAAANAALADHDLEIPADLLDTVQDDAAGIRHSERNVYFTMLARVRDVPASSLERAADKTVSFAELFNDPESYRGRLVSLTGELRRFLPMPAGENDQGFTTLYDGWFFTEDGGRTNPIRIVCTGKPDGLPVGEQIQERVRFTGYFFKRYGYITNHGLHTTPMLIGKRVRWTPRVATSIGPPGYAPYVFVFVLLLATGFCSAIWWFSRGETRLHAVHMQRMREPANDAIAALNNLETTDVNSLLRQLGTEAAAQEKERGGHRSPDADADTDAHRGSTEPG